MKLYFDGVGALQNSGFWLLQGGLPGHTALHSQAEPWNSETERRKPGSQRPSMAASDREIVSRSSEVLLQTTTKPL